VEKYCRESERPQTTIRRMRIACWIPKATNIYSEYVLVFFSYSTTNKMHLLSPIIYDCESFYMFRTVFPSIIRSSKLRKQQRYMSNSCCYQLHSGMRSQQLFDICRSCIRSFELLMMDEKTVRNT
jgi:hypothetical protein